MPSSLLKECIPPVVLKWMKRALIKSGLKASGQIEFFGNFSSWSEALKNSTGYDSPNIVSKIENELTRVLKGDAFYERDSVAFQEEAHPWSLVATLLRIALEKRARGDSSKVKVIDFGGSLGSHYFHVKKSLGDLVSLDWNVIELGGLVDVGRRKFQNPELHFYSNLEEAGGVADVFLLCSTLQYLEKPYEILDEILSMKIPYLYLERTPLLMEGEADRLTVQKVSPDIYSASYPAWFLSQKKLWVLIGKTYEKVYDLRGPFDAPAAWSLGHQSIEDVGALFKIRT